MPEGDDAARYLPLLREGRWFSGLPSAMQDALVATAVIERFADGKALFRRGDAPSGLCAVVDGMVRIGATTAAGKDALLSIQSPPMWFGEIAVIDRQPRTHDALADGDCAILRVPTLALDAMLAREPAWWQHVGLLATQKLRLAFVAIEELSTSEPLRVRLARRVLLMHAGYGDWTDRKLRALTVRQEQLASMLSTSRQSVNAALKELERDGLVRLAYGTIEIVDVDGLIALAGSP